MSQVPAKQRPTSIANAVQSEFDGRYKASLIRALPDKLKPQVDRIIARCLLTIAEGTNQLKQCTPQSICMAAVKAAEHGLAIDGKLGYIVPFKSKDGGYRAQFIPGYLGLVAVARRTNTITHVRFGVIYEHDDLQCGIKAGQPVFDYKPFLQGDRGEMTAAYCLVYLPNGDWDYQVMDRAEIEAVRQRSKSKDYGPWVTDYNAMAAKTVVRRAMKAFAEDPGLIDLMSADDESEGDPTGKVQIESAAAQLENLRRSVPDQEPTGDLDDSDVVDALPPKPAPEPEPPKRKKAARRKPEAQTPAPAPAPAPAPEREPEPEKPSRYEYNPPDSPKAGDSLFSDDVNAAMQEAAAEGESPPPPAPPPEPETAPPAGPAEELAPQDWENPPKIVRFIARCNDIRQIRQIKDRVESERTLHDGAISMVTKAANDRLLALKD